MFMVEPRSYDSDIDGSRVIGNIRVLKIIFAFFLPFARMSAITVANCQYRAVFSSQKTGSIAQGVTAA